jgi:hypothetical protein
MVSLYECTCSFRCRVRSHDRAFSKSVASCVLLLIGVNPAITELLKQVYYKLPSTDLVVLNIHEPLSTHPQAAHVISQRSFSSYVQATFADIFVISKTLRSPPCLANEYTDKPPALHTSSATIYSFLRRVVSLLTNKHYCFKNPYQRAAVLEFVLKEATCTVLCS